MQNLASGRSADPVAGKSGEDIQNYLGIGIEMWQAIQRQLIDDIRAGPVRKDQCAGTIYEGTNHWQILRGS
ncbi:hypothetical protein [Parasphingorhabdus sp.]|uniref:hypothetical protein n=1 Tax=Parasphingorhabdus sp. TaxID=2709688 RepID=UPI003D2A969E